MIELYDAALLEPRRDWTLPVLALALAVGTGSLSAWGWTLHGQWRQAEARNAALRAQIDRRPTQAAPAAAMLADLERRAQLMEARLVAHEPAAADTALRPSAWLQRLGSLSSDGVSLARVEVDRSGATRIEGVATDPAAANRFVQAFARQESNTALRARSIELRQDKTQAPYLRFALRASAPGPATAERPPAASAVEAAASAAPTQIAARKP
ncbi:MAG: hypothetical protein JNN18_05540 [Rubrivivax sp.]|jgi:cytoskeletal protein RodZ|nr:hypothetical protein [Rubrivivax sp.]